MRRLVPLAIFIAVALAVYAYWSLQKPSVTPPAPAGQVTGVVSPPAVRHPIEAIQPAQPPEAQPLPSLDDSSPAVEAALHGLIGQQAVLDFLGVGNHIRQLVATVDNLPRQQAPARMWPVNRTPGQFVVEDSADGQSFIAAANFARYAPFVNLAVSVDADRAVALYVRFYPLLQQAYEQLGYRGKYFNDRLVEVIDHLLAAPQVGDAIAVVLPPQDPSTVVERPWVMYRFADPALESLSAGQKILVRMGPENASRLKHKLAELRARLASAPPG